MRVILKQSEDNKYKAKTNKKWSKKIRTQTMLKKMSVKE